MATTAAPRRRLRLADLTRLLAAWVSATFALIVTGALLPGLSATTLWSYAGVAAVAGIVGLVLRPVLVEVSARVGWIAVLLLALAGEALIMYIAILYTPGIQATPRTALIATWVSAAIGTLIAWATTAGTDDGLVTSLARRAKRVQEVPDPDVDGIVFVQMDGVPLPVLQWAVQSGGVPNIRRWLASGEYQLRGWTPQIPCTTPASQQGILHGTIDRVPAFRWYDRELGRVLVANRPADARIIEERASNGRGLLCDDGVSISNIFTGDAARSLLTMSRTKATRGTTQTRRAVAWFLASPSGFMRSFTRTVAEIVKERWQASRQVRRDLDPRVHRGWDFAVLRALTNALLRDLNTALVAEEMRRGTRSVYVDYVDYDEIAHHAGMFRPESLASLDGLDRTLGTLARLAEGAPRRYHLVIVSDHGQSQGAVYADKYGVTLADLCAELMEQDVQNVDAAVEGLGRADSLVGDLGTDGLSGKVASRAGSSLAEAQSTEGPEDTGDEPVIVLGSGNLGLVYLRNPRRSTLDELEAQWPALVPGLVARPGIAFVAGVDDAGVPWAIGPEGRRNLDTGELEGSDPMEPFEPHAPRTLRRAVLLPEAPDLYVNSTVDPVTSDVHAFEGLVGSHGGLGGWQDHAVLLAPTELLDGVPEHIEGADQLHRVLVGMLESCGQRQDLPAEEGVPR
ncbi:MAG TPA: phage holin family protein [Nocardioides sp.]|uniref:phage holin family protein n=1 Tax=Nocardioides sp. TaxID=35761 RepID=UPI002CDB6563|nr:phage holin family protein [Nocardioides sp.]HQR26141.1 phage holin family protein [Nocardioides sp.]